MRFSTVVVLLAIMLLPVAAYSQNGDISISGVTGGFIAPDTVITGQDITFSIRLQNNLADKVKGITNGFRVYSPNGATWGTVSGDTTGIGKTDFDGGFFINYFHISGSDADTIGFGGFIFFGPGLPAGADVEAYTITIGPIPHTDDGKTICIDSSYYPPSGVWKWQGTVADFPVWHGPYCYNILKDPTDVRLSGSDNLPDEFTLGQNYPNPFNPTTTIKFDLPARAQVSLSVYNVLGQKVTTLVNETLPAGRYETEWDGSSDGGVEVASGIYFYRLHTEQFTQTKKMILLK